MSFSDAKSLDPGDAAKLLVPALGRHAGDRRGSSAGVEVVGDGGVVGQIGASGGDAEMQAEGGDACGFAVRDS